MSVLSPAAKMQFTDITGAPLVGGFLYTYIAGTTTPLATYTDSSGITSNPNPVVLNARGEASVWLGANTYKFKLTDSNNNEIWTVDNISAPTSALSPILSGNVVINTDSSNPALKITQVGTGAVIRVQDSTDPDATPFIIDNTGQVGIGTAAPLSLLNVDGGNITQSLNGTLYTTLSGSAGESVVSIADLRDYVIKTNGTTRATINDTAATFTVPIVGNWANIPSGTVMLFVQTAAPTGWTKSTANNDKALRVVSGAAGSGGVTAFSSVFTSRTISVANMPTHTHAITDPGHAHDYGITVGVNGGGAGAVPYPNTGGVSVSTTNLQYTGISTQSAGSGTAMDFAVQYVDVIIATKN